MKDFSKQLFDRKRLQPRGLHDLPASGLAVQLGEATN